MRGFADNDIRHFRVDLVARRHVESAVHRIRRDLVGAPDLLGNGGNMKTKRIVAGVRKALPGGAEYRQPSVRPEVPAPTKRVRSDPEAPNLRTAQEKRTRSTP
jgi:hypothetical protein